MTDDTSTPARGSQLHIRHVDLPDLREIFADSITGIFFDGQSLRVNFGITRFEQTTGSPEANAQRFPACRLVLTPGAAIELANQLQQLMAKLVQSGVLKSSPGNLASAREPRPEAASLSSKPAASPNAVLRSLDELADTIEGYIGQDWKGPPSRK